MTVELPQETLLAIIAVQQEIVETDAALQTVMDVVVRAATRLTGADASVVELHEGDEMVYRATAGTATNFLGLRLRAASSLSGLCVELDQPLRCDDSETDDRVDRKACLKVGARSLLVTPLRFRAAPLGVLKVYSARANAFDALSAEILRMLVGLIAASMHRAKEYEGMTRRAMHDQLTGLPNREQLESILGARIARGDPFAIAFLDLNGFKRINDEQGHACGDRILQTVARRLSSSVRGNDTAARLGGDEFVIVLEGISSRDAALEALQRLLTRVAEPIPDGDRTFTVSATAGVAVFPSDAQTSHSLLSVADAGMYAEKRPTRSA
ncbi:MAG TPA: sensor domain-containing diguanylate cyclase [Thermoanaerobaculia bacterium]|nr:sensor domain-containing diguanylate cyclase [Thermoanaerobaculia bacterium]